MMKQVLISSFLIFFLLHSTTTSGQSPAQSPSSQNPEVKPAAPQAQAQAPAGKPVVQAPALTPPALPAPAQAPVAEPIVKSPPRKAPKPTPAAPNVTDILDKAGGFSVFTRLLHNTDVINQIENQLNSSNSLTILAPTNGGFSSLKAGTLNSLTPEQKVQLLQFHIIPNLVSLQNFETLTNPVRTQASNTKDYPLNITTEGGFVNISTGVVNTTLSGTVYADSKLAIYRVDSVLLPIGIFAPRLESPTPSPAPEPALAPSPVVPLAKPKKGASSATSAAAAASNSTAAAPANSAALKPKFNATAAIAPVAGLDASSGVSADGVMSVGFAVTVILLGQFV